MRFSNASEQEGDTFFGMPSLKDSVLRFDYLQNTEEYGSLGTLLLCHV